jgi:plastocyanin
MRRLLVRLSLAIVGLAALATPALAGGWAAVRLDAPPAEIVVDVPWRIGFTVKQHDRTPVNLPNVYLAAQHRETGESLRAEARQEGAVGHYLVEATFPRAGAWKWAIHPDWFPETSFETLRVLAGPGVGDSLGGPASIARGTCGTLGEVAFPLADVQPLKSPATSPVAMSVTTLNAKLADLVAGEHAIAVRHASVSGQSAVACGDLTSGGMNGGEEIVIGLQPVDNSGDAGVAVLRAAGEQTTVTLYALSVPQAAVAGAPPTSGGATAAIEIAGDAVFSPSSLVVPVGTTVTWKNVGSVAHTVTGDDLAFNDSGPLDPGESFSKTFAKPGTFTYRCGPHPNMIGTVVVQ